MMDMQLVNAPLPPEAISCRRTKAYAPLALLCLATHIRQYNPQLLVEVIDGEVTSIEDVIERIHAPVVGISSTSFSYCCAVQIAQQIKSRNPESMVVLGGIHASQMARQILANRSCFDIVIEGQGELPMLGLLQGKELHAIENCWYRDRKTEEIRHNKQVFTPIDKLSIPDYSLVDLKPYFSNFSFRYPSKSFRRGVPILSSTGCKWRLHNGGCVFCSIPNTQFSILNPSEFWSLVIRAYESTGADFLWDVSDTFTSDPEWINLLSEQRPQGLPVVFHVYGRPDDITPQVARNLMEIGVEEILLGIESFDYELLRLTNKGITLDSIFRAVNLLREYSIKVAISLILGLPGESEASLKRTLEACQKLTEYNNIIESHAGILIPTPGSRVFSDMLRVPEFSEQYADLDILPFEELTHDFLTEFTECGPDVVYDYYARIDALFPSAGPFYANRNTSLYPGTSYSDILPS